MKTSILFAILSIFLFAFIFFQLVGLAINLDLPMQDYLVGGVIYTLMVLVLLYFDLKLPFPVIFGLPLLPITLYLTKGNIDISLRFFLLAMIILVLGGFIGIGLKMLRRLR